LLEAIDEAIFIAQKSGASLQISHLKCEGKANWGKVDAVFEKIEKAAKAGLNIHADRYPYIAYNTGLSNLFPLWAREGGTDKFLERLKDKEQLNKIRTYVEEKVASLGDWNSVLISSIGSDSNKVYQGKTIKQIAAEKQADPFEFTCSLIIEERNRVGMVGFGMDEEGTERILAYPRTMIASDAGSNAPYGKLSRSRPHPRSYGTFPRAIGKYVRERKIVSLPEMIKKMTSMPAQKLGLKDRGVLKVGNAADVVLFDFNTIQDKATFIDPHQYPVGILYVIVNGVIVIKEGEHTGELPGKVIRS
jgi:N-acyl-D-amino-acid deacylase